MTVEEHGDSTTHQGRWDSLIGELHRLREAAGMPSYEALTRTVMEQRMADGQNEHAARIAKSSVHYAFRFGRSRINGDLVRELVRAMGGNPAGVDSWVAACEAGPSTAWTPPPLPEPDEPQPITPASLRSIVLLLLACIAFNLLGRIFVDFFRLPVYLDMVGTAIAAIALGPWKGAAVGVATNVVGVIGSGWISLPFALVNMTGALLWGYGMRRWGMGRTLPRFFSLNVLVAIACSVVAVPIIAVFLDQDLRVGHDVITTLVQDSIECFPAALGFANLLTSLGDKLVSGFFALVVVSALPVAFRHGVDLVAVDSK